MIYKAQYDQNGNIYLEEYNYKTDTSRLQSCMFKDRADLWHKSPRKKLKPIPSEQLTMLQIRP